MAVDRTVQRPQNLPRLVPLLGHLRQLVHQRQDLGVGIAVAEMLHHGLELGDAALCAFAREPLRFAVQLALLEAARVGAVVGWLVGSDGGF